MKFIDRQLVIIILIMFIPVHGLTGQDKKQNYGKATDEIFPYQRFLKAYKYHFLEPVQFYGAGREIVPPTDLK
jgi:hypothetical protein